MNERCSVLDLASHSLFHSWRWSTVAYWLTAAILESKAETVGLHGTQGLHFPVRFESKYMTRWPSRQDAASAHENLITDNKDTLPSSLIRAWVCVWVWQQEIGSSVCPRPLTACGCWHSAFAGAAKGLFRNTPCPPWQAKRLSVGLGSCEERKETNLHWLRREKESYWKMCRGTQDQAGKQS